jgi:RNA polymerase sigma-70 factor (ECF subfamily)
MTLRRKSWLAPSERFTNFYRENAADLLVFFARRVLDPDIAMELTAETLAQAYLSRRRFRGSSPKEARAWLYGIARHQLSRFFERGFAERKAIQRLGIQAPTLQPDEQQRVEELAAIEPLREVVRGALAELSPDHKDAIRLRVVEERSYPEVAGTLGISEPTARARVSRGLRALARALEAQGITKQEAV